MPATLENEYRYSGGIPWKEKLLEAGGIDLLSNTPFENYAKSGPWPCWLIELRNVFPEGTAYDSLVQQAQGLLLGAAKLGKPNSEKNDACMYRTIAASLLPCLCRYYYGGFGKKHRVHTYSDGGKRNSAALEETKLEGLD
jgi:hypothetical protein